MMALQHPPQMVGRAFNGHASRQLGLSLVELLVGVAIGLLVMLAALGTLSFSRVSATTVTDTVRLQQDATIAMGIIGRQLRSARALGFVQNAVSDPDIASVNYAAFTGLDPASPIPVSLTGTDGPTDTLIVGMGTTGGVAPVSCGGFQTNLADTVSSEFDVLNGALRCDGSDGLNSTQLIQNVEDFQVWYGIRDPVNDNIRYLTATQIGVAAWPTTNVNSVLVCLRLSGTSITAPQPPVGFVAPPGCQGEAIAWDGRFRKVFRQVFTLRNAA